MDRFQKYVQDYKIKSFVERGGYGEVFKGIHCGTGKQVAIKLSEDKDTLMNEYEIMIDLQHDPEFVIVYDFKELPMCNALIMELLGNSLDIGNKKKPLSLNCIYAIGVKLINQLEKIHDLGILHRDIKPGNILITQDQKNLKLIDYGIATHYIVKSKHKDFKTRRKHKGTALFASINTHLGFRQSRRDDLESLCYSLIYLINGTLPWDFNSKAMNFKKWQIILSNKINSDNYINTLPIEIQSMLHYIRKLTYAQRPNYCYLITLLSKNIQLNHVYVYFDWYDLKKDTNLNKSQQIVEGATIITKLKRKKCVKRATKSKNIKNFCRTKEIKSFGSMDKYFYSQYCQNESKKSEKKKKKPEEKKFFLQLPTCDLRFRRKSKIFVDINEMNDKSSEDKSSQSFESDISEGNIKKMKSNVEIWKYDSYEESIEQKVNLNEGKVDIEAKVTFNDIVTEVCIDNLIYQVDTPKSVYPEFKDKKLILERKKEFIRSRDRVEQEKCCMF